ncbi:MAG: proton-conducting transporter membrane subunit, partial [Kineosporiaceae bacterium]
MTAVAGGLVITFVVAAVGLAAAMALPARHRSAGSGGAAALLGLAGVWTGQQALTGGTGGLSVPLALPLADGRMDALVLAPDRLGGLFMMIAGMVGAVTAVFGIGYAHGPAASRTGWSGFVLFLLGMQVVPAAGDILAFLLAWELMAVASTVLVLSDHSSRAEVRSAGLRYAVMTQLSFLAVLAGFAVLAAVSGSTRFSVIASSRLDPRAASIAFVVLSLGFATKAGLIPVHVWLPRAHPQAPSHVSAAMSAAMVKMGVYGVLLTVTRLLPGGARWWGLALLSLALPSALYGILQASVASDLKRLLAYSTTENVGLILSAAAVSMLARSAGAIAVADVALVAALMLAVSHAAFKTVLFLGAGAVLQATGERDLDRLGGLGAGMPVTAAAFGIAALGAAALPVSSGFAAEWVFLQALIHGNGRGDRLFSALLPATIAVVALTAGLALLTFVKAYGIAFLARPRCAGAAAAREVSRWMQA